MRGPKPTVGARGTEVEPSAPATDAGSGGAPWDGFLDRLMRGDHAAFAQITRIILATIARTGAFELRDSWADIAQDVLAVVVENVRRGALRDPAAFIAYTQTICRRRVGLWLERHGRLPSHWETEPTELEDSRARAVDPALRMDLERALSALPRSCRCVIEATYLHGCTYEEAATRLGLTVRQVKRLQSRGRERLRRALEVR